MKYTLNDEERILLDQYISETENRTGVQIVLAVVERSDSYPELPWKAFALGTSIAGLVVILLNTTLQFLSGESAVLLAVIMILAAGVCLALSCVFIPDFSRLFLQRHRAEVETRQYAESLFLSREMFTTPKRKSVLLLISLFERRIVVLPDRGLKEEMNQPVIENIIRTMRPYLSTGRTVQALKAGLEKLAEMLSGSSSPQSSLNELPDDVIEEKGA